MTIDQIQPTTLNGVKSLARKIKSKGSITHTQALSLAAQRAGFANYKAALNHFSAGGLPTPQQSHALYISAWWWDELTKTGGRETLLTRTSVPFDALMTRYQMRQNRFLGWFRLKAPDHIADHRTYRSQDEARFRAAAAARTLTFVEASGLKPTATVLMRSNPHGDDAGLPFRDHCETWIDPKTKQVVVTDEPYSSRIDRASSFAARRQKWIQKHNWSLVEVEWQGMYYPDFGSRLFLLAEKAQNYDLDGLAARLNQLSPPVGSHEWKGESGSYGDEFLTPGTIAMREARLQERAKKREQVSSPQPRNSVAYTKSDGRRLTRPAVRIDLKTHREIGELLKLASLSSRPWSRVNKAIDRVRAELDDWLALEYPRHELTDRDFVQYYYGAPQNRQEAAFENDERRSVESLMSDVRTLLTRSYEDCAPLRHIVLRLERIISPPSTNQKSPRSADS